MKKILLLLLLIGCVSQTTQYSELHDGIKDLQVINGKLAYVTADNTNCTYPTGCTGDCKVYYDGKIFAEHNKTIIRLFELDNKIAYITEGETLYIDGKETGRYNKILEVKKLNNKTIYTASKDYHCTRHTCTGSWLIVEDGVEKETDCTWIPFIQNINNKLTYKCHKNNQTYIIHGETEYGPYSSADSLLDFEGKPAWLEYTNNTIKIIIEGKQFETPYKDIRRLTYTDKPAYIGDHKYVIYGETYGPYHQITDYKIISGKPAIAWHDENYKYYITYEDTKGPYNSYHGFFDLNGTLAYNAKDGKIKLILENKEIEDATYPILYNGKIVYIKKTGEKYRVEAQDL